MMIEYIGLFLFPCRAHNGHAEWYENRAVSGHITGYIVNDAVIDCTIFKTSATWFIACYLLMDVSWLGENYLFIFFIFNLPTNSYTALMYCVDAVPAFAVITIVHHFLLRRQVYRRSRHDGMPSCSQNSLEIHTYIGFLWWCRTGILTIDDSWQHDCIWRLRRYTYTLA